MTISGEQIISGYKTFKNNLTVEGNIEMTEGKMIDGVDLSQLYSEAVFKDKDQIVSGDKHFHDLTVQDIEIKCNESCYLKELLKNLTEKTVKVNQAANITGTKTFAKNLSMADSLHVKGFINGVKVPNDLVPKKNPLVIYGKKTFKKPVTIYGDVELDSTINNFNISEWYKKALRLYGEQTITGNLTFVDKVNMERNLKVNGLINELYVPDDLVKVKEDEVISAHKTFNGKIKIGKLSVNKMVASGLVDGVDVEELNRTIVKTSGEQTISGNVIFKKGLEINGDLQTNGDINGVNLTEINANAMRINGDQTITGRKVCLVALSL